MVQGVTRSTCSDGFTNSGERDCTIPVGLVLGSSSGKLHGLLGKLSEGSDRREVTGAAGELGRVRRSTEEATGKMAMHEGGLYSRSWARYRRGHGGRRPCMGARAATASARLAGETRHRARGSICSGHFQASIGP
jgi:hypothetical protein